MASIKMEKRPVLFVALTMLLLPLHTPPLEAQEGATISKGAEELAPAGNKMAGQEGMAAYYANRYNGRKTLSGTRYDPEKLTAASPYLPMGCKVKVVNLANGREVMVTVNDRCKRKKAPFIDLSRCAARILGFLGRGKAKVRIVLLADNEQ